jgi:DUF1680 family protein
MENHVKYQEAIYYYSDDTLYINLYIPSKLNWEEKNITVIQSGDYLRTNSVCIKIKGDGKFNIRLRVPYWAEKGFFVKINGEENENNISNKIKKTSDPLVFELDEMLLMPNYAAWNLPYHAYFKIK